ncbi:MAG: Amino-acid carrier protein AlsT [Chlamydiia bacterium]|nr:Amino-acid carrier protein AlsT [Chlamydiia bacterium]
MSNTQAVLDKINNIVWGPPLLVLLVTVGLYLTIRLKGVQFRYLWYAHKLAFSRQDDNAQGDISHFQALMTSLAATIGIGSITGVATAIATGGVGALFWMWIAAGLGMATKYAEGVLAIKYRIVDEKNEMCGGPMYYIEKGTKQKWLAVLFALFGGITAIGTGNMIQSNSVALAMQDLAHFNPVYTGLIFMVLTGIALFGGIKSIGKVSGILVPTMAAFYILGGIAIVLVRAEFVPQAFAQIFKSAFTGQAAAGGFIGATVMQAIQMGVSRGVFSSEAGLGSSPIAAAAAKTDTPSRQALVSMCSVFITTGIVCTITALVVTLTGVLGTTGVGGEALDGSALVLRAFNEVIPGGSLIVTIALIPFAFSTTIGWAYYGEKCIEYLFGCKSTKYYRIIYTLLVFPGAILSLKMIWSIANILNGLMAFPNLIGLFCLGGVVAAETKSFKHLVRREQREKKARKKKALSIS